MSDAYDMIDRFLRNNLHDDDYAEYSEALDSLCSAQPAQAVPPGYVLVPVEPSQAMIDAMQSSGWMLANYRAMLAAAQGEKP